MANIFLLFAFLCIIANFVLSTPNIVADGWGNKVCSIARSFCDDPQQLLYAAMALGCLWLLTSFRFEPFATKSPRSH